MANKRLQTDRALQLSLLQRGGGIVAGLRAIAIATCLNSARGLKATE